MTYLSQEAQKIQYEKKIKEIESQAVLKGSDEVLFDIWNSLIIFFSPPLIEPDNPERPSWFHEKVNERNARKDRFLQSKKR